MLIFIDNKFSEEIVKLDHNNKIVEDFLNQIIIKSKNYDFVTSIKEKDFQNLLTKHQDPIIRSLSDNCKSIEYGSSIENVITDSSTIHKILLVNNSITKINNNSIEYFNSENIQQKWVQYSTLRDDFSLPTTNDYDLGPEEKFYSWNNLKRWKHPVSKIYIYDKYLLVDKKNQSIKNNLLPMLSQLSEFSDNELEIRIFTLKETLCVEHKNKSIEQKIKSIFYLFEKEFENINLSISLYENSDDFFWLQHDRILLTNYYLIDRGAGFNIFDSNNEIKDNSEMNFKFVFHRKNYPSFSKRRENIDELMHLVESNSSSITNFILYK